MIFENEETKFRNAIAQFAAIISGHPLVIDGVLTQVGILSASEGFQHAVENYIDYRVGLALDKFEQKVERKITNAVDNS